VPPLRSRIAPAQDAGAGAAGGGGGVAIRRRPSSFRVP
jgi:hypothetical protein